MIYRISLRFSESSDDLMQHGGEYRQQVQSGLEQTGFVGHACWPDAEFGTLEIVVEGAESPDAVAEAVGQLTEADSGKATQIDDAWDELAGLSSEERTAEIVKAATEREGEVCGRCNATILPHQDWCEYNLGPRGRAVEPDLTGGQDRGGVDVGTARDKQPA